MVVVTMSTYIGANIAAEQLPSHSVHRCKTLASTKIVSIPEDASRSRTASLKFRLSSRMHCRRLHGNVQHAFAFDNTDNDP